MIRSKKYLSSSPGSMILNKKVPDCGIVLWEVNETFRCDIYGHQYTFFFYSLFKSADTKWSIPNKTDKDRKITIKILILCHKWAAEWKITDDDDDDDDDTEQFNKNLFLLFTPVGLATLCMYVCVFVCVLCMYVMCVHYTQGQLSPTRLNSPSRLFLAFSTSLDQ